MTVIVRNLAVISFVYVSVTIRHLSTNSFSTLFEYVHTFYHIALCEFQRIDKQVHVQELTNCKADNHRYSEKAPQSIVV